MGYWEFLHIWHNKPFSSHIMFYGRYIDNVIIIWDGNTSTVSEFVAYCNNNNMGLKFTSVMDGERLDFVDLELFSAGNKIHAKSFTKPTARNSFLHYNSCHHPRWLNNIPKSQFCRLKKNCTRSEDYDIQSQALKGKFLEKCFLLTLRKWLILIKKRHPLQYFPLPMVIPIRMIYVLSLSFMFVIDRWRGLCRDIGRCCSRMSIFFPFCLTNLNLRIEKHPISRAR